MKASAGILLYRKNDNRLEVFLVHPGGPFWKNKDMGAWSIPKGIYQQDEDPLAAAIREFKEETGTELTGNFISLGSIKQKTGKVVCAWAIEGNIDAAAIVSNTVPVEWPPRSGKMIEIPEVDRGKWFSIEEASDKINPAQAAFITRLLETIGE